MPQVEAVKSARHKRTVARLVGLTILAIVVIACAGGLYWYLHLPSAQAVVKQADALDSKEHYDEANTLLQKSYGRMLNDKDRALIESRIAATAYDQGNYRAALSDYEKQDRLTPGNLSTLQTIGDLAYQLGDKQVALSAYKQVLPLMQNTNQKGPTTQDYITQVQQRIQELQQ